MYATNIPPIIDGSEAHKQRVDRPTCFPKHMQVPAQRVVDSLDLKLGKGERCTLTGCKLGTLGNNHIATL